MRLSSGAVSVCLVVFVGVPSGATLLDLPSKFRYGIELVHRLFNGNLASDKFFFGAFKKHYHGEQAGSDGIFLGKFFAAIVESVAGQEKDVAGLAVKMSVFVAKMIRELMEQAQDPELVEKVLRHLAREKSPGTSADCVELLICKISPFVRGMQKSLKFFLESEIEAKKRDSFAERVGANRAMENDPDPTCATEACSSWMASTPLERMYFFLPKMDEFVENGDACDDRHPACIY